MHDPRLRWRTCRRRRTHPLARDQRVLQLHRELILDSLQLAVLLRQLLRPLLSRPQARMDGLLSLRLHRRAQARGKDHPT